MLSSKSLSTAIVLGLATLSGISGHTWIDCLDTDREVVFEGGHSYIYGGTGGNGFCSGYANNYPGRGDSRINNKMTYKVLMDDAESGEPPACKDTNPDYSGWRTRLEVSPGQTFYYGYTPNGHVAKDKSARGTHYGVYWTGKPDTTLDKIADLTEDKLIDGQLHDFDDGVCGETYEDGDFSGNVRSGRAGNGFPCVGEVTIPEGTAPGIYNFVWYWKFYNDKVNKNIETTGGHYGGAAYSSCFQVEVTGNAANDSDDGPGKLVPSNMDEDIANDANFEQHQSEDAPEDTPEPTEEPTDAPTDPPTEPPTEAPTDAPTDAPTEPPTEAPTDAPTDAPTEPPMEAPAEVPAEASEPVPTEAPAAAETPEVTPAPQHPDCDA